MLEKKPGIDSIVDYYYVQLYDCVYVGCNFGTLWLAESSVIINTYKLFTLFCKIFSV